MSKRVVIVGAGPGGLAAAMLLAAQGLSVKLIDRLGRVGGRTSSLEAQGFRFDMGPTFFLYPAILREIFEACGRRLDDELELTRLDPQYRLVFEGGGAIDATADVPRMKREIARLCPADAEHFERYLADNRVKFDAFRPILQRPFLSWRDVLSPQLARMLPLVRPWASVDRDLKRFFSDPRVRLAFSFQSKYLGMSPFQCPSLFTILSFLEYEYGVYHPAGGCGAVSEAMARVAREMGVDLSLSDEVQELMFEGRRAVGVRSASGEHRADAVVLNADFADAMNRLVPDRLRSRWTDARLEKKKYSCSTFMMYLGVEGLCDHLAHHTIFLAGDYTENLLDIEKRHTLSANPSVYVQNAGVTDPTLAPRGMSTLYVLAPVTHEHPNVDWEAEAPRFRRVVLNQLAKLGLGNLEGRIRYERVLTPAQWRSDMRIYRGATFNLAHSLGQMLHLRPRNRFEDLDGVYLVGGGTHPGSGLPVIYESARITSRLVLEGLGLASSPSPSVITPPGAPAEPAPVMEMA